jgi:heat shock protein HtpX
MTGLQVKMWILVALMFGILYGVITGIGAWSGTGSPTSYIILALLFTCLQYLIGPALVSMMMKVKWVSEKEEPELHRQVTELAQKAGIPKPRIGISQLQILNAFAFGRTIRDGRVCVTQGIRKILNKEELKAVLGHEIAHLKHRDMMIITLLSVIPLILYWIAWSLIWGGTGGRRQSAGYAALIGLGAMVIYFIANLLVLAGSRTREYYADERSVKLGSHPKHLASALYKLVYGSAQSRKSARGEEELHRVEGLRAFFLNDVGRAHDEIADLRAIDSDFSGTIDQNELLAIRSQKVKLKGAEKVAELFTTHPNMLKRIKRLATMA